MLQKTNDGVSLNMLTVALKLSKHTDKAMATMEEKLVRLVNGADFRVFSVGKLDVVSSEAV